MWSGEFYHPISNCQVCQSVANPLSGLGDKPGVAGTVLQRVVINNIDVCKNLLNVAVLEQLGLD